mgnify:CR=1 FL=1
MFDYTCDIEAYYLGHYYYNSKNYDMMKLEWQSEGIFDTNCYFDEKNNRIYQIEYLGNKIKIKTYRIDYGMHYMYL